MFQQTLRNILITVFHQQVNQLPLVRWILAVGRGLLLKGGKVFISMKVPC